MTRLLCSLNHQSKETHEAIQALESWINSSDHLRSAETELLDRDIAIRTKLNLVDHNWTTCFHKTMRNPLLKRIVPIKLGHHPNSISKNHQANQKQFLTHRVYEFVAKSRLQKNQFAEVQISPQTKTLQCSDASRIKCRPS